MNDLEEKITEKVNLALKIVKNINEEFKVEAFKVILTYFLQSSKEELDIKTLKEFQKDFEKSILTLTELVAKLKPKSYADRAMIISYYLLKNKQITIFNIDHIKDNFNKLRIPKPKNMTDTLNNLIKKGFLRSSSDVDNKKGFEITNMGIRYVDELIKSNKT